MSGSHLIECWEHGSDLEPPKIMASLVQQGEQVLWVARLSSSVDAATMLLFSVFGLLLAWMFSLIVPWAESLEQFCGSDPLYNCKKLYYIAWPIILIMIPTSASCIWLAWKAKYKPWVIVYAITDSRALVLDERKPRAARSVDLDKHPPRLGLFGAIGFGAAKSKLPMFARLEPRVAERALYWATAGRLRREFQVKVTL